jgi:hypothetical protein
MESLIPIPDTPVPGETEIPPPTPSQLAQASLMAGLGIRPLVISIFFSVSLPDLMKSCGVQITAAQDSHKAILAGLKEMALSKRHPSATLFWVKTFCAHLLPTPAKARSYQPDPNGTFNIEVYNNDGEPNYDY